MACVGFLGPGRLGGPMVEQLLTAGHDVRVLARRTDVADRLAAHGATPVPSAAEAARGASVVVVCLFSDGQLLEVLEGSVGLLAGLEMGSVVVSHVTGLRETLLSVAARAAERGAAVVDAPVSGGEQEIRAAALTVLLGGDDVAAHQATAVIRAYASPILRTGRLGTALAAKLVNNLVFAAHGQIAGAALELGEALGLSPQVLLQVLEVSSGRSFAGGVLAATGSVDRFVEQVGDYLRKDVAACRAELAASGTSAGVLGELVERGPMPLLGEAPTPAAG